MWQCSKCQENIEDSFAVCWACGTSREGIEDPSFQPVTDIGDHGREGVASRAAVPSLKALTCLRCDRELTYVGTKHFHEGKRWGVLGDLGELFVNKERFDVYCCPRCGRVEFFVDGIGEDLRQQ